MLGLPAPDWGNWTNERPGVDKVEEEKTGLRVRAWVPTSLRALEEGTEQVTKKELSDHGLGAGHDSTVPT